MFTRYVFCGRSVSHATSPKCIDMNFSVDDAKLSTPFFSTLARNLETHSHFRLTRGLVGSTDGSRSSKLDPSTSVNKILF